MDFSMKFGNEDKDNNDSNLAKKVAKPDFKLNLNNNNNDSNNGSSFDSDLERKEAVAQFFKQSKEDTRSGYLSQRRNQKNIAKQKPISRMEEIQRKYTATPHVLEDELEEIDTFRVRNSPPKKRVSKRNELSFAEKKRLKAAHEAKALKRESSSIGRIKVIAIALIVFVLSGSFAYASVILNDTDENLKPVIQIAPEDQIFISIPSGAGSSEIADILAQNGLVAFPFIYSLMSRYNGYDGTYKAGTHIVSKKLSYSELMDKLSEAPEIVKVTIPEGFSFKQISDKLSQSNIVAADQMSSAALTYTVNSRMTEYLPKDTEKRLEGIIFPDTYNFGVKAPPKEIFDQMIARFDVVFKDEYYNRAKELGMSPYDVLILASIIEKESAVSAERRIISSVFHNRLANSDKSLNKLQSCATIQYILYDQNGSYSPKLTDADTSIVSPYNTYLNPGLPPTPICSPGEDSILAALYPDKTSYLYFVAKGDGTNFFTKTYKEHLAAKKKYGA